MSVRIVLLTVLISVVGPWSVESAWADFMLVPTDINGNLLRPGEQFRAVFLSSVTRDAQSTDIADYDRFITNLAVAAGLDTYFGAPLTWHALGSTATVNAIDRLPRDFGSPALYRLDGGIVSLSTGELWNGGFGAILFPITVTEKGVDIGGALVWTGTRSTGIALTPLGGSFVTFGVSNGNAGNWVAFEAAGPPDSRFHLYGYSSVLTVPQQAAVPEPTSHTLVLMGLATLTGGVAVRRRVIQTRRCVHRAPDN